MDFDKIGIRTASIISFGIGAPQFLQTPPGGHPARMQGLISAVGNVAKWDSAYASVATVHTERMLRVSSTEVVLSCQLSLARIMLSFGADFGVTPGARNVSPFSRPLRW